MVKAQAKIVRWWMVEETTFRRDSICS
jgi:hypothetical protein